MGLAIRRVIRRDGYDYKAADPLELRHLGMSDLEETPNVQSGAQALGDRASFIGRSRSAGLSLLPHISLGCPFIYPSINGETYSARYSWP